MDDLSASSPNFSSRLRDLLPPSWFPDETEQFISGGGGSGKILYTDGTPVLNSSSNQLIYSPAPVSIISISNSPVVSALLSASGSMWSGIYALLAYVQKQTRLSTATGVSLDEKSQDYLGSTFPRRVNENDASYSSRVKKEIVRKRNTRAAIIQAVQDLIGTTPTIFVPSNAGDAGGYNTTGCFYNSLGAYGSLQYPFQFFVTVKRGSSSYNGSSATVGAGGYNQSVGGYNQGYAAYGNGQAVQSAVTDEEIYATINAATAGGEIAWVKIIN